MLLAVQAEPVRSLLAGAVKSATRSRSLTRFATPSAADEIGTSMMQSTPARSIHSRLIVRATSGLFCWSALTSSTWRLGSIAR